MTAMSCMKCIYLIMSCNFILGFPGGPAIKNPSANEGDMGSISGQEDPTCYGATKASRHNYFAATKMIKE